MAELPISPEQAPLQPPTQAAAARVEGDYVAFGPGVAGAVSARQDAVFQNGATAVTAAGRDMTFANGSTGVSAVGRDLAFSKGGSAVLVVGGKVNIDKGGALLLNAGGSVEIEKGGGGVVIAPNVQANRSQLGLVIAGKVELHGESRVLFSTTQAAAFGALFGAVFGIIAWLFRRR